MFQSGMGQRHLVSPWLKCIANIVATIIFLGFAAVVLVYFCPCIAAPADQTLLFGAPINTQTIWLKKIRC